MCTSVQAALEEMFAPSHGLTGRLRECSDRAFAKMRRGFSAEVFDQLNVTLLELARPLIDAHRWHGWRVVAADGSRLRVSTRRGAELDADHYAFALYLPGAELTLHAALHPADGSERQMLFEALDATEPDDLLVLDRGLIGNTMAPTLRYTERIGAHPDDLVARRSARSRRQLRRAVPPPLARRRGFQAELARERVHGRVIRALDSHRTHPLRHAIGSQLSAPPTNQAACVCRL